MATTNPFQKILTALEKPDGGEFGKYYSLPALNDPRIGFYWGAAAVVDLACMRDAMNNLKGDSNKINPLVNLEYLGRVVFNTDGLLYPDSVVGTDSHTTMIDGLGVAGWGVGGIEAEATMPWPGKGQTVPQLPTCLLSMVATMGFFPVDRVTLQYLKLTGRSDDKGFAVPKESQNKVVEFTFHGTPAQLRHGDVVIAAITSCTNTSNPSVMLGAALVAKKACELGLEVGCLYLSKPWIKTSLAPGSGVVTKYLQKSGLQQYLNQLGFHIVGYGCTTCIGNSGDIDDTVASAITENDIVAAAVLSGNRNFEGRVHPLTRANYLASPPLVVAYALAGTVDIDFETEPIVLGKDGKKIFFRDIWPSNEEVAEIVSQLTTSHLLVASTKTVQQPNTFWNVVLIEGNFNSYGSRRGNDEIMARGTFANIRLVNKFLKGEVGPKTIHIPTGEKTRYKSEGHATIILAGAEYGSGSSRDWAAKGPMLLGVKAVIAKSFERIHRNADTLGLTGEERYTIDLPSSVGEIKPGQDVTVVTDNGKSFVELAYFDHGGILQYVIRNLIKS
ncbi:hypothetical protein GBA52_023202 [Prunus armeniaca]|nr:hypothetical protein GBA52_023202 [Prunus armeniaca]